MASIHRRTVQKYPHEPDNHDGVITDLEPGILECEVKWALESITMNKASGGDGIPVAAKSLKSCPTLCNPIDGSPPGFPVPGILQARTLEWASHCIVFLYFFALITEEGPLISSCYSLVLCIQMGISFHSSFAFTCFLFQLFVMPLQTTILPFCLSFSWGCS